MLFKFFQDWNDYKAGQVAVIDDELGIELQEQGIGEQELDITEPPPVEPPPPVPVEPPPPIEPPAPIEPPIIEEPDEKEPKTKNRKERRLNKQKKSK